MTRSVLVVDDDASFRVLAAGVLRSWGYEVVGEAGSVAEAIAAAAELRPDAVLVDVGLPDGDGLQLSARMHVLPWRPRVLLTSADAHATTDPEARSAGAVGFIPKSQLPKPRFRAMLDG
jgi:CheY-like chemotaxis protein